MFNLAKTELRYVQPVRIYIYLISKTKTTLKRHLMFNDIMVVQPVKTFSTTLNELFHIACLTREQTFWFSCVKQAMFELLFITFELPFITFDVRSTYV